MQHTIEIGEDGVAYVNIIGDGDVNTAREFVERAETIFDEHPGAVFDAVVDMTQSGLSDYKGVEVYRVFLQDERLGKLAFVIKNDIVKTFVQLALQKRERETEFFTSIDAAKQWILEHR